MSRHYPGAFIVSSTRHCPHEAGDRPKAGRHAAAAQAAASHRLMAVARSMTPPSRAGLVRVAGLGECSTRLRRHGIVPRNERLAILTNGGGGTSPPICCSTAVVNCPSRQATRGADRLMPHLVAHQSGRHRATPTALAMPPRARQAGAPTQRTALDQRADGADFVGAVAAAPGARTPVIGCWIGGLMLRPAARAARQGFPAYDTRRRAAGARLHAIVQYRRAALQRTPPSIPRCAPIRARAQARARRLCRSAASF